MLNTVILIGNLGCDPEIKMTQDGHQIVHLSLATSCHWIDENGEWQTRPCWHKILVFRESVVRWIIKNTFKKGSRVWVEGSLTYNMWKDRWGYRHRTSAILVSDYYGRVGDLSPKNPTAAPNLENCESETYSQMFAREDSSISPDEPFQNTQQNEGETK